MTNRNLKNATRGGRRWLWLLIVPGIGFAAFAVLCVWISIMVAGVEKSPGYELAARTLTGHAGVTELLGAPVRVTRTKAKYVTKTLNGTTLRLTLALEGSSARAEAQVIATERGGRWNVERATIASSSGEFGLLADGALQPIYDPKVLASGP